MASGGGNNGNGNTKLPALTAETIQDFLSLQKQELTIRLAEVQRDNAEITHNQSIAKHSIEAQERDRKHGREEKTKRQRSSQWFAFAVVVVILVFAGYAIHSGQTALVLDLVKVIVGFAGGMGYQAYRNSKRQEPELDDD